MENKLMYICSPYRGCVKRNKEYARYLAKTAIENGFAPIATHLYITEVLDENEPKERETGLAAGREILKQCKFVLCGGRYGITEGMAAELKLAEELGTVVVHEKNGKIYHAKNKEEATMRQELKRSDFEQGNKVNFAGHRWNVLAEVGKDSFLCITEDTVCNKAFDEDGSNDWRKSRLRKWLNEEFIKNFAGLELVPQTQDLTADDGLKDYGSSTDLIFLLTADQYRAYRQYMKQLDKWWWLITPDSPINTFARYVTSDGTLYISSAYSGNCGVRPACVLHLQSESEEDKTQEKTEGEE